MPLSSELRVRYGQATEAGRKQRNEDCLGIRIPEGELLANKGIALIIADGVSAAEAGREASEICVQGFLADYFSTPDPWQVKTSAHRVLASINRWLYSKGQAITDERRGYVCPMSAVVVKSRTAHVFHVGDTRAYRLRDGALEPLTQDHRAWVDPQRQYLTRAMGMHLNQEIDYRRVSLETGDALFLSTDGVHDYLGDTAIAALLAAGRDDPDLACQNIVTQAAARDSPDNLSCQVLWIDGLPSARAREQYDELRRLPFPPLLQPGAVLDGYVVEQLFRENPRSQLYLVKDSGTGERAVMKTPSPACSDDAAYIERFIMEEWIGRRVASPHLVQILEKKGKPAFLFYLMEHVEGISLREWIAGHPRPEIGRVVEIIRQLIDGLRALHRKETLHQDLKPDNILVRPDGHVVIVDFGSAFIAGIDETYVPFERAALLGTMHYSAPEYRLGRRPTPRSDLFSLAVIAYEMFSGGRPPFGEQFARAETLRHFSSLLYTPAARHNPLVPAWIDGALRKALQIDPALRYEVFSEFLADLQRPNPAFLAPAEMPLMERNPVLFWKSLAGGLALVVALLLWPLFRAP